MPGLVPGIQPFTSAGASGEMDPGAVNRRPARSAKKAKCSLISASSVVSRSSGLAEQVFINAHDEILHGIVTFVSVAHCQECDPGRRGFPSEQASPCALRLRSIIGCRAQRNSRMSL